MVPFFGRTTSPKVTLYGGIRWGIFVWPTNILIIYCELDCSPTHCYLDHFQIVGNHNHLRECPVVQKSWSPHPEVASAVPLSVSAAPSPALDCLGSLLAALPEVGSLSARRGTRCQSHSGRSPRLSPGQRFLMQKLPSTIVSMPYHVYRLFLKAVGVEPPPIVFSI